MSETPEMHFVMIFLNPLKCIFSDFSKSLGILKGFEKIEIPQKMLGDFKIP